MYHGSKKGIENINDEDILYKYDITSPDTMIRIARLSLWSRILCKAPEVMKSLCFDMAKANVGWPGAVYCDLKWACDDLLSKQLLEDLSRTGPPILGTIANILGCRLKSFLNLDLLIALFRPLGRGPEALPSSLLLFVQPDWLPL